MPLEAPQPPPSRPVRSRDSAFWLFSALLGLLPLLPRFLGHPLGEQNIELVLYGGLLLGGIFLGFLRPVGCWRWGVGALLLAPFVDFLLRIYDPNLPPLPVSSLPSYISDNLANYLITGIIILIGSLLGALLSKAGTSV